MTTFSPASGEYLKRSISAICTCDVLAYLSNPSLSPPYPRTMNFRKNPVPIRLRKGLYKMLNNKFMSTYSSILFVSRMKLINTASAFQSFILCILRIYPFLHASLPPIPSFTVSVEFSSPGYPNFSGFPIYAGISEANQTT